MRAILGKEKRASLEGAINGEDALVVSADEERAASASPWCDEKRHLLVLLLSAVRLTGREERHRGTYVGNWSADGAMSKASVPISSSRSKCKGGHVHDKPQGQRNAGWPVGD